MTDIKTRKALYKKYSKCKWMEVSKACKVTRVDDILINMVCVDEVGRVYLEWHKASNWRARCNEVNFAEVMTNECIQGLFTGEKKAIVAAKKWFNGKKA